MAKQSRKTKCQNITIVDVAQAAGVSYSTVSRVLNDEEYVKETTRLRVESAIQQLGYVANQQARSLRGSSTSTLGLIVRDLGSEYIGAIVRGIDSHIAEVDYDLMVYTTYNREEKEATYAKMMMHGMADGVILVVPRKGHLYLEQFYSRNFPHIIVDEAVKTPRSSAVCVDNYQATLNATRHLIELGHRDIAMIAGEKGVATSKKRLSGFNDALKKAGLSPNAIVYGNYSQQSGFNAAEQIFQSPQRPTAIMSANDVMAFGVMEAARHRKINIPNDISLIGFDDVSQSKIVHPALTTVRQPLEEMGKKAAESLLLHISAQDTSIQRTLLPTELIVRASTAAPYKK